MEERPDSALSADRTTRITNLRQVLAGLPGGMECLVVIYGTGVGKKYDLHDDVISIGRDPENAIVLESDAVSRRHARIERLQGNRFLVDLNSTNGTFLDDAPVVDRVGLRSGGLIKIGETIFKYLAGNDIEAAWYEEIYRMAVTDGLTQVANKRALTEFLDRELSRARRHGRPLTILMLDIDHFKRINDNHGHLTGDAVLRELAGLIQVRVRREELFARYGGEEFVLALPETDLAGALDMAESIRRRIAEHPFRFEGQALSVTVSVGAAQFSDADHRGTDELLKAADKNLYVAKNKGRNCVHG